MIAVVLNGDVAFVAMPLPVSPDVLRIGETLPVSSSTSWGELKDVNKSAPGGLAGCGASGSAPGAVAPLKNATYAATSASASASYCVSGCG